jgi:ParB-like chromosome segregation protein Spo0J
MSDEDLDLEIDMIELPTSRLRRLRNDVVDELAKSMEQVGLIHPILVAATDRRLIADWHRLEGAKKLGWTKIRVTLV